jgi:arylsulfatase A-like enzyme
MIVVDTLRADHLGAYGAQRNTSPNIDRLATGSVRFERAYSAAPWTKPSVASMISGLYPTHHQVESLAAVVPDEVVTLAEILREQGYATAGVVSHSLLSRKHGFAQGFDVYLESEGRGHEYVSSPGVTSQARAQLNRLADEGRPFFLFVHYFDPHYAYQSHPEYGFAGEPPRRLERLGTIERIRQRMDLVTEAELDHLRDRYDEEIRFTDESIGGLLTHLEALDLDSQTIVVLTGDHGEEFKERDWIGHVRTVYDELVRVPLLIRAPAASPRTVADPVSLVSLVPTLLELLGLQSTHGGAQAPSLASLITGGSDRPGDYILTEVNYVPLHDDSKKRAFKRALIGPRYKLIHNVDEARYELYDMLEDEGESIDLSGSHPEDVARLRSELEVHVRRIESAKLEAAQRSLSNAEVEQLEALGYVGSAED